MTDDPFFERVRRDAAQLRHEPDPFTLARIRARIQERIAPRPNVMQLLAAWFRPLAAALTAIAVAAAIGMATIDDESSLGEPEVEVVMAGETFSVSQ